jgi:hypothetical protein
MKKQKYRYGTSEYWKNADEYKFDIKEGGRLSVLAFSPKSAKLKATNWEKWLVKTGRGKEKVLKDTIKRILYKDNKITEIKV